MSSLALARTAINAGLPLASILRASRNIRRYSPYIRPGLAAARQIGRMARRGFSMRKRTRINYSFGPRKRTKRSFKRSQRQGIGKKPGTGVGKSMIQLDAASNYSTRTLNSVELTDIGVRGNNSDQRTQDQIVLKGFKICGELRNLYVGVPLYINVAVISPKSGNTVTVDDFFRNNGESRAIDFDLYASMSSLKYHCLAINTDKYRVLMHKRMIVGKDTGTAATYNSTNPSYRNISKWVPLNRQLQFEAKDDTAPSSGNVFLVHWASPYGEGAGGTPSADSYGVHWYVTTYFNNAKMCAC